jgi:hypothetical protein
MPVLRHLCYYDTALQFALVLLVVFIRNVASSVSASPRPLLGHDEMDPYNQFWWNAKKEERSLFTSMSSGTPTLLPACNLACSNGGTCSYISDDLEVLYIEYLKGTLIQQCNCPAGYTGTACEIYQPNMACDMDTKLCHNGMACQLAEGTSTDYKCQCAVHMALNSFVASMCIKSYTEYCTDWDDGDNELLYCTNGGKCKSSIIAALVAPKNTSVNVLYEHSGCICAPDYYGPHCELLRYGTITNQSNDSLQSDILYRSNEYDTSWRKNLTYNFTTGDPKIDKLLKESSDRFTVAQAAKELEVPQTQQKDSESEPEIDSTVPVSTSAKITINDIYIMVGSVMIILLVSFGLIARRHRRQKNKKLLLHEIDDESVVPFGHDACDIHSCCSNGINNTNRSCVSNKSENSLKQNTIASQLSHNASSAKDSLSFSMSTTNSSKLLSLSSIIGPRGKQVTRSRTFTIPDVSLKTSSNISKDQAHKQPINEYIYLHEHRANMNGASSSYSGYDVEDCPHTQRGLRSNRTSLRLDDVDDSTISSTYAHSLISNTMHSSPVSRNTKTRIRSTDVIDDITTNDNYSNSGGGSHSNDEKYENTGRGIQMNRTSIRLNDFDDSTISTRYGRSLLGDSRNKQTCSQPSMATAQSDDFVANGITISYDPLLLDSDYTADIKNADEHSNLGPYDGESSRDNSSTPIRYLHSIEAESSNVSCHENRSSSLRSRLSSIFTIDSTMEHNHISKKTPLSDVFFFRKNSRNDHDIAATIECYDDRSIISGYEHNERSYRGDESTKATETTKTTSTNSSSDISLVPSFATTDQRTVQHQQHRNMKHSNKDVTDKSTLRNKNTTNVNCNGSPWSKISHVDTSTAVRQEVSRHDDSKHASASKHSQRSTDSNTTETTTTSRSSSFFVYDAIENVISTTTSSRNDILRLNPQRNNTSFYSEYDENSFDGTSCQTESNMSRIVNPYSFKSSYSRCYGINPNVATQHEDLDNAYLVD